MTDNDLAPLARQITTSFAELRQDNRMLRAAVNDFACNRVTRGEIEALRHDVNRAMERHLELVARVDALEQSRRASPSSARRAPGRGPAESL
jgi:ribosomal protein L16/L10AE